MKLYYAKTIAEHLVSQLKQYCHADRIHIAGSIRRCADDVKDIEIVCLPFTEKSTEKNLFDEIVREWIEVNEMYRCVLKNAGTIIQGKFGGRHMKVEIKQEIHNVLHTINLDLFTPREEDYYRQLAIRTGSEEYAHKKIAAGWVRKGWIGIKGTLYRKEQCYTFDNKEFFPKADISDFEKPPIWKSEREFFDWIGLQYLEPGHRSM